MRNVGETILKWMGKGQLAQARVPGHPSHPPPGVGGNPGLLLRLHPFSGSHNNWDFLRNSFLMRCTGYGQDVTGTSRDKQTKIARYRRCPQWHSAGSPAPGRLPLP